MSTDVLASPEVTPKQEKVREIVAVLKTRPAEAWGLNPRTYRRYLTGELPEQWDALLGNPDLAAAVLRAAVRFEIEGKPADE